MGHSNDFESRTPPESCLEEDTVRMESNNLGLSNSNETDQINTMDSNIVKLLDNGEMDLSSQALMQHQQPIGRITMRNCDGIRIGPEYKIKADKITIIGNVGKLDAHNIPEFINQKTKPLATIPEETNSDITTDIESVKRQNKNKKFTVFQSMKRKTKLILLIVFIILLVLAITIPLTLILFRNKHTNSNNSTTMSPINPVTKKPPEDFFVSVDEWSTLKNTINETYQNHTKTKLGIDSFDGADFCDERTSCIQVLKDMQSKWKYATKYNLNYNYLIGGDGRVYESRGNYCIADYNSGYSPHFIKIGFIGNYTDRTINSLQERALKKMTNNLIDKSMLDKDYTMVPQCCRNIPGETGPGTNINEYLKLYYHIPYYRMIPSCACADYNIGTTTESTSWW